jgi:hypothetical protein
MRTFKPPDRSEDDIRKIVLAYLHDRYWNGSSARGKRTGRAVAIMKMRKDLKASHHLTGKQVQRGLFYLLEHEWAKTVVIKKMFPIKNSGTLVERETVLYEITAEGIDKFDGASEFTPEKVPQVRIDTINAHGSAFAIGGDNHGNVHHGDVVKALAKFREFVMNLDTPREEHKALLIADVNAVAAEVSRPEHNGCLLRKMWERVKGGADVLGIAADLATVSGTIAPLLG